MMAATGEGTEALARGTRGSLASDSTAAVVLGATRYRPSWARRSLPWATTIAIVLVMEVLCQAGVFPHAVPAPSAAIAAAWTLLPTPEFLASLGATLAQFIVGLAIGVAVGVAVGIVLGTVPMLYRLTHYTLDFLRYIPSVVYLPLLLLVMGARPEVAYVLAAIGSVWPMLFQTYYGVVGIPPILKDTARIFGLTTAQRLRYVTVQSVSPFIATGLRIAAAHALVVVVAVQIITTVVGLGRDIAAYSTNGVYPEMYALVAVVGIIGLLINWGLEAIERRQLHWHSSHREARP